MTVILAANLLDSPPPLNARCLQSLCPCLTSGGIVAKSRGELLSISSPTTDGAPHSGSSSRHSGEGFCFGFAAAWTSARAGGSGTGGDSKSGISVKASSVSATVSSGGCAGLRCRSRSRQVLPPKWNNFATRLPSCFFFLRFSCASAYQHSGNNEDPSHRQARRSRCRTSCPIREPMRAFIS